MNNRGNFADRAAVAQWQAQQQLAQRPVSAYSQTSSQNQQRGLKAAAVAPVATAEIINDSIDPLTLKEKQKLERVLEDYGSHMLAVHIAANHSEGNPLGPMRGVTYTVRDGKNTPAISTPFDEKSLMTGTVAVALPDAVMVSQETGKRATNEQMIANFEKKCPADLGAQLSLMGIKFVGLAESFGRTPTECTHTNWLVVRGNSAEASSKLFSSLASPDDYDKAKVTWASAFGETSAMAREAFSESDKLRLKTLYAMGSHLGLDMTPIRESHEEILSQKAVTAKNITNIVSQDAGALVSSETYSPSGREMSYYVDTLPVYSLSHVILAENPRTGLTILKGPPPREGETSKELGGLWNASKPFPSCTGSLGVALGSNIALTSRGDSSSSLSSSLVNYRIRTPEFVRAEIDSGYDDSWKFVHLRPIKFVDGSSFY